MDDMTFIKGRPLTPDQLEQLRKAEMDCVLYGNEWQRTRAKTLKEQPYCAHCGDTSKDVHHIIAKRLGGTDDDSNLVALCHRCHSAQTRQGR